MSDNLYTLEVKSQVFLGIQGHEMCRTLPLRISVIIVPEIFLHQDHKLPRTVQSDTNIESYTSHPEPSTPPPPPSVCPCFTSCLTLYHRFRILDRSRYDLRGDSTR